MALSDSWLRQTAGKQQAKAIEKTDRDGLSVRVTPKGKIVFQIRFWLNNKQCRMDLGSYPSVSLKEARELLIKYKADIEKGLDPRISKKLIKHANINAITLNDLFYQWYNSYCIANKKGHYEIKRSFEIHLLPKLGLFPVEKITTMMFCDLFDKIIKHSKSITERLLVNTKQMLNYAVRRMLIKENVLLAISSKADFNIVKNKSTRALNDEEIRYLYLALENSRIELKNKIFIKLCLIYGCRNSELRLAVINDFDFELMVWTIPKENHKTGKISKKPLKRPILPETQVLFLQLLELSGCDYLMTNSRSYQIMSKNSTVSLPYNLMQWLRKNANYEMAHWSLHDLRRTARTYWSSLCPPHIAEIMLGHTLSKEWGTYDQHLYLAEQTAAYSAWLNKLNEIIKLS